jgi:asparagine synthetase B (glutamine-hydrolysing)
MIKYPTEWSTIGQEVSSKQVAEAVQDCISTRRVRSLSLSGGIDSTLLLYFMKLVLGDPIYCYTVALNEDHPDFVYAKLATTFFNVEFYPYLLREQKDPDGIVKSFYSYLSTNRVDSIIAGDGVDEFTCGYYSHQKDQSEQNYISWIRKLKLEQLIPLNSNSGEVEVYLPYLSPSVVSLFSLIPLYDKVDQSLRKKVIVKMAQGNIPDEIINRWKFGFCDASSRKDLE